MAPKKREKKGKTKAILNIVDDPSDDDGVANWSYEQLELLAELMAKNMVISTGQSGAVTGRAIRWPPVVAEFHLRSGKSWTQTQLKAKHDNTKTNFKLWLKLLHGTTGLGWDNENNTVAASKEWWEMKILEDSQYARFKKQGFGPTLEGYLHDVYDFSRATGSLAFSTTSNNIPAAVRTPTLKSEVKAIEYYGNSDGYYPQLVDLDGIGRNQTEEIGNPWKGMAGLNIKENRQSPNASDSSIFGSQSATGPKGANYLYGDSSSSLGKRSSSSEDGGGNKRTRRLRQYDDSIRSLRSIDESIKEATRARSEFNHVMSSVNRSVTSHESTQLEFSIQNGISRLNQVQNVDPDSNLYLFAYSLIMNDRMREAFLRAETVEKAWKWVVFEFNRTFQGKSNLMTTPLHPFAERLLTDREFYNSFVRGINHMMDCEDELIQSGALLAASLVHQPPPRSLNHCGSFEGKKWVDSMLNSPRETRIFNAFRMNKRTFCMLCDVLSRSYGLKENSDVTIREKVGIFLHVLAKKQSNRDTAERFGRSGWTVSHYFHEVLDAMDLFGADIVRPRDPTFSSIPQQLIGNAKYSCFKNAIGALDGSHVKVIVDEDISMACRGRKRETTMNCLAVCDFDLLFTFVVTGWEGSAHDALVLAEAKRTFNFPHPPPGKYYLGDKGYANRGGVVTPYSSARYHSSQFRGHPPTGRREVYNRWHSSLRSAIERAFGVVKGRWHILQCVPHYKPSDQARIIAACFALNNYIRLLDPLDSIFNSFTNKYNPPTTAVEENLGIPAGIEDLNEPSMDDVRESIADAIMQSI